MKMSVAACSFTCQVARLRSSCFSLSTSPAVSGVHFRLSTSASRLICSEKLYRSGPEEAQVHAFEPKAHAVLKVGRVLLAYLFLFDGLGDNLASGKTAGKLPGNHILQPTRQDGETLSPY